MVRLLVASLLLLALNACNHMTASKMCRDGDCKIDRPDQSLPPTGMAEF